jgi:phosphatidylserine/phosphatidylglycerophosphate/cardiolipin synthase-like enzyme
LLITDPINDLYGATPSPVLTALRRAGVEVVTTDLEPLRDSNPVYSGLWRLAVEWWSETSTGPGWLPNPLDIGPDRVPFDAWARLMNLKANRRGVLIADDGAGGIVGVVGSARPHDASSAHSNVAVRVRGEALRPLFESEIRIARFSGWRGVPILLPAAESPTDATTARGRAPVPGRAVRAAAPDDPSARVRVSVLTEGGLRDALLERIDSARSGDRIEIAMLYLSERAVIQALIDASRRGVTIRIMLDPNVEAFGAPRSGIPNRPVASELVSRSDGAIKLRWYRTHGEQFNAALVAIGDRESVWLTTGSAQLTRRNLGDFTLEANVAVEAPRTAAVAIELDRWFDTLWNNRAPAGVEFTAEFGAYADPSQSRYWAYRLMESTGIGSF